MENFCSEGTISKLEKPIANVKVVTYDPKYLSSFVILNREWIEHHFVIEENDRVQLEKTEENIVKQGGEIFFLLEDELVVGTCAMIPHGDGYELAKMAVSPTVRGKGYGDLLMVKSLEWAKEKGASSVMLLSNTILEPAIRLYKKHGFETIYLGQHKDYERANIEMKICF